MQRRSLIQAATAAAATLGVPRLFAQDWPNAPVRIVVGFPPGGGTDALARVVAQKLTQMWNQQVIVENKAGVAGVLAADYDTLPESMQRKVIGFFDLNETWLSALLERGLAEGSLRCAGSPDDHAKLMVGALEGAMLVARTYHDGQRFSGAADRLLAELCPPADG